MIKLTCHAPDLVRALNFASMAIERRNTIPILGYALVEASESVLRVSGTNLDQQTSYSIDCDYDTLPRMMFTVPPRAVLGFLRGVTGPVEISVDTEVITFSADGCTMRLRNLQSPKDWPVMDGSSLKPISGNLGSHSLTVALLSKALQAAAPCISTEETRYYLNGVFFHRKDDKLILVATDGHRLARYETDVAWAIPSVIVPKQAISMLRQQMKRGQNGGVECVGMMRHQKKGLEPETQLIRFAGPEWEIITKVIDGTYPDYTRVIPEKSPNVSVTLTGTALGRIYGFERTRPIQFNTERQTVLYKDPEGIECEAPCQIKLLTDRAHFTWGINQKYLQDFTRIHETIRLEGAGPGDPLKVLTDDPALLWVVMPMRV